MNNNQIYFQVEFTIKKETRGIQETSNRYDHNIRK